MPKGQNKDFLVAGVKNLLKTNYGIDTDLIDVEAEIDSTLTFEEHWNAIKKKYHIISLKEIIEKVKQWEKKHNEEIKI